MKKYLLLILTMLSVSIGAWADATVYNFGTGSTVTVDDIAVTVNVNTAGDFGSWSLDWDGSTGTQVLTALGNGQNVTLTGTWNANDLAKIDRFYYNGTLILDFTSINLAEETTFADVKFNNAGYKYYVKLPSTVEISNGFFTTTQNGQGAMGVSVNGTTASIYLPSGMYNSTSLGMIPSGTEKVVFYTDANNTGEYGKTSNLTYGLSTTDLQGINSSNFTAASSTITTIDLSNIAATNEEKYISNKPTGWKYVISPIGKVSASGALTAADFVYLKSLNAEFYDFSAATFTFSILDLGTKVKGITLPNGLTLSDADKAELQNKYGNLRYVFSPTNDNESTVPNRVYVVEAGGLVDAFANEPTLRNATWIKVGSRVSLSAEDLNFNGMATGVRPTQFAVLDLSNTVIDPSTVSNFYSHESAFRVILPDNWSADQMTQFHTVATNWGSHLAALYSYAGTTLNILGVNDNNYADNALQSVRIVRTSPATTEVKFVKGKYNDTTQGQFGTNMLAAVNNASASNSAGATIKSVTVASGLSIPSTSTFTNTNLETINLSGVTGSAAVTTSGCTNLKFLMLNNATLSSVTANNSNLESVGLSKVTIGGNVSLQGAKLTSFTASGTINGDIDLSRNNRLSAINISNVNFNNTLSTNTGDLIITRQVNSTDVLANDTNWDAVYVNGGTVGGVTYAALSGNIKTSTTFGTGNGNAGVIYPYLEATPKAAYNENEAGYEKDDCALTITLDGTTNFNSLSAALTYIKDQEKCGTISSVCNLTINTTNNYELTSDDITAINGLTFTSTGETDVTMYRDATLNLDGAELDGNNLVKELSNSYIKNVILPRGLDKNVVNATFLAGLTNDDFNGAISTNDGHTALVGYVNKPGQLRQLLSQVPYFRPNVYQYTVTSLRNVTLGGTLIAKDIATSAVNLDADGNYSEGASAGLGEALNNANSLKTLDISNAIFVDATKVDTPEAEGYIMEENMTLSGLGWGGITYLLMPTDTRMNTVPANFLRNCQQIPYLCIPYNYQYINNEAFYLSGMNHITTTDSKGAEIDNGDDTYTFSKNLLRIGEALDTKTATSTVNGSYDYPIGRAAPVFGSVTSGLVHDVYILRNGYEAANGSFTPTICYRGCFASGMTYGWGGFDGGNVYCREKYKNGSTLYTVLHYPDQASLPEGYNSDEQYAAMEKAYTDVTKVYTKKDQTGAVDANGDPLPWPTFSELGRSYNQAIRGLVWGDWTELDEHKTIGGEVNGGSISFDASTNPGDVAHVDNSAHWDFTDYVGWHEFVLSKATYVAPDENIVKNNVVYREYEEDHWYTFCIPFDMTRKQVIDLLGVPASDDKLKTTTGTFTVNATTGEVSGEENTTAQLPDIRTLKQVTRTPGTRGVVNLIMSKNLSSTGEYWKINLENPGNSKYTANDDKEATADDKILIRGGYPYIIKPYKVKGTSINNLGQSVLMRYAFPLAQSSIEREDCYESCGGNMTSEVSKFAKPYEGHKIQAFNGTSGSFLNHGTSSDKYFYTFIGQYWKQSIPRYSFYMYNGTWYHFTLSGAAAEGYYWFPYRCVIMVTAKNSEGNFRDLTTTGDYATVIPEEVGVDDKGHAVFNKSLQITFMDGMDDSFTSTTDANAREYNFLFDDYGIMDFNGNMETTAIDRLDNEVIIPANSNVYNMNGQLVGKSLNGLSKGMYIVNGKKIVIK